MGEYADPTTVKAISKARAAYERAREGWSSDDEALDDEDLDDEALDDDPAGEAADEGRRAVEHLEQGRWDEAIACAEQALAIAEEWGREQVWREFALLVEEAAETGRERG